MSVLANSNAIETGGYNINNSLRLRSSATAYLSRTPASASSTTTWTWSGWVKRGSLGSFQRIFNAINAGNNTTIFEFNSSDKLHLNLQVAGSNVADIVTTQVFRDPSAWYHFVFTWDTTNATAANRIRMYVNGSQITTFDSASYPAQNYSSGFVNTTNPHYIGGNSSPMDGYVAEVNFVNAQALTPSSFGQTDAVTGSWQPKAYTGTYGTNGFYLKFSDIATTSGSNAGLGKDFSGNSNYWTTNNISVTSGTTYDAMTDSPTLTSATVANYCVINPLWKGSAVTITNGNLSYSGSGATNAIAYSTFGMSSGKWYAEWTQGTTPAGGAMYVGISLDSINPNHSWLGQNAGEYSYLNSNGFKANNSTQVSYGATWGLNDVIGIAFDADAGTLTFYKNGVSQGTAYTGIAAGNYYFANGNNPGSTVTGNWNFGQRAFTGSLPTGYKALNTYNLPDSTIKKGNSYMDATLYTGNGGTQSVVNTSGFKPDLVWSKSRSQTSGNHLLTDSVRGTTKSLMSNDTGAEGTRGVTAFNSNGFTYIYPNEGGDGNFNAATYVAWQWQAGQGSTSNITVNQYGSTPSIASTVSVNTTAGFSIVAYTGTGVAGTVGHGLGATPKLVILKRRNSATNGDWCVYTSSLPATNGLFLNTTNGSTVVNSWNNTAPTSSVFSISNSVGVNASGSTYIAYCWAEIAGFSKFGSYTGNGSADGPFVYTGFRPKWIMIKRTDTTADWQIIDTPRQLYNDGAVANQLRPNSSVAEASAGTYSIDILSNGFKDRTGASTNWNTNGGTYIYAAFAENPFRYSLAR